MRVSDKARRQYLIDELHEKGWTHTRDGVPIEDLPYEELRAEAALMSFREIDTESAESAWF